MRIRSMLRTLDEFVERALWCDATGPAVISFAQNGEDILLLRAFGNRKAGFYIDVGANDPVVDSVTKTFYDRGWNGVNAEPGRVFRRLAGARPRDVNLQVALSDHSGEHTLYEFPDANGLSTLSSQVRAFHDAKCVERMVPLTTLAEVCRRHAARTIDFLKIDVEGHEREVIAGGDWRRFRPRIVVVESATTPNGDGPHREWEPLLVNADYEFASFDGINRYYVRREDSDLLPRLRLPLNVLDNYVAYRHVQRFVGLGPLAILCARCLQTLIDLAGFWYPRRLSRRT
jgi:FkbM family methyltransferase